MAIVSAADVAALADFVGSVDSSARANFELQDLRASVVPHTADAVADMLTVARVNSKRFDSSPVETLNPLAAAQAPVEPCW